MALPIPLAVQVGFARADAQMRASLDYFTDMAIAFDTVSDPQERRGIAHAIWQHCLAATVRYNSWKSDAALKAEMEHQYGVPITDLAATVQPLIDLMGEYVTLYLANVDTMNAGKWTGFRNKIDDLIAASDFTL